MKKHYRIKSKFRFTVFVVLVCLLISCAGNALVGSLESHAASTEFIEVTVEAGDTLWNLAAAYGPADADIRVIVYNICAINHVSAETLRPGQILSIPTSL